MVPIARLTTSIALSVAVLSLSCGGDAESAADGQSRPVSAEVEPAPSPPQLVPATDPEEMPAAPPPSTASSPVPARAETVEPVPPTPTASAGRPSMPPEPQQPAAEAVFEREPVVERPREPTAADFPPEPMTVVRTVAAGRTIELSLGTELSTESNRSGDAFWATVTDDVLASDGEVLLPVGARVEGRVKESRESAGSEEPAVMELAVESIEVGSSLVPIGASIVEIDLAASSRDSDTETAIKVGAGAVAGALLGRILGSDSEDAVKGAVVGAAAGTAYALSSRDGHAKIGGGARILIRMDEALVLPH